MPLQAGTRLGPYEVLSLLGAGGMGEVYRARDTRLGREMAIKVLPAVRRDAWIDGIGPATRLEIEVPQPAIRHRITVHQLERWANGSAVNPDERIRKDQLKAILGTGG